MARANGRQDCETCKAKYQIGPWDNDEVKRVKMKGPPCDTCFPGVLPENDAAFFLAQRVLTGEGVRMESLEAAMRVYRIPRDERMDTADRVLLVSSQFLKRQAEQRENQRKKK